VGGEVIRRIQVQGMESPRQEEEEEEEEEVIGYLTRCEMCGDSNRAYELLHCDRCGLGYHLECMYPHLAYVTLEALATLDEWYCNDCL
jgi:hypothetical protein